MASGWRAAEPLPVFGALAAAIANYLFLRLSFFASVWVGKRLHPPEPSPVYPFGSPFYRPAVPTLPEEAKATIWDYLGNFICATLTLGALRVFGIFAGSLIGIVIMWPLAVISKSEKVQGTHAVTCYALYFLAGVSLMR